MHSLIYLASQSPRRSQLLTQIGVAHALLLPGPQEDAEALELALPGEAPVDYVQRVTRLKLEAAIPRGSRTVVLDEHGTALRTTALAQRLKNWQLEGDDVALIIGGPDGLDPQFKQAAHERIRLSDLTLPHAMVRVLLIEQLYRAWSVNAGHPYHRE